MPMGLPKNGVNKKPPLLNNNGAKTLKVLLHKYDERSTNLLHP